MSNGRNLSGSCKRIIQWLTELSVDRFSIMTELIWEGKYDKDGKKVAPVRIALPFQTIETVNESAQQRQKTLDMFASGKSTEWRNRLIWGDKKYVLPSLLSEFAGKIDLIYIDPPFDTGADFSYTATIPDNPETEENETTNFTKEPNIIERKAYRDTWGKGLQSYLHWFYETVIILRDLLKDSGSLYVHLDDNAVHYAKIILDEIFGYDNYRNEIIHVYGEREKIQRQYNSKHQTILFYVKNKDSSYIFNPENIRERYSQSTISKYKYTDEDGRKFRIRGKNQIEAGRLRAKTDIRLEDECEYTYRDYFDSRSGPAPRDWFNMPFLNQASRSRTGYPTQKNPLILERIIKASSNEGDLVLDCFVGSGTTTEVAEKLSRRWIACDLGKFAIHTTRKRMLSIENVKPFVVQNLGKYERQEWMSAEFPDTKSRSVLEKAYRNFVLNLYQAESVSGYQWLYGAKSGRMIHVGSIDAPVSIGDIKSIVQEFWKTVGKSAELTTNGVDVLGWDFAFEINETAKQFAAENNVDIKFKKIPRELLEKKAVEQGDIKFFEMAHLDVKVGKKGKKVTITLNNFIVPPDDIPEDVQQNITHWRQWIDYWAVDWNYRDDTFHNEWQTYRTKQSPTIKLKTSHTYEKGGSYNILVKVIDILGNDTTRSISVNVK